MKKVLVFLIVLFASIMIVPNAYAAEGAVASLDGVEYTSLQDAIENANGKTVTLLSDVTESITIFEGITVTLDLGSYTITNEEGYDTITNYGNLTIVGSGTVDNVSHGKAALKNEEKGVVVLESGTYIRSKETGVSADVSGGNSFYTIQNYGYMTIKDGVQVLNNGSFSSLLENGFYNGSEKQYDGTPTLIIEGGYFSGGLNTIKNDDWGVLVINGGTFTNVAQAAVLNWNKATINGGTFESSNYVILNGKLDDVMDTGELIITGGTFIAGSGDIIGSMRGNDDDLVNVFVQGGIFNKEVSANLLDINDDEALLLNANGYYEIAKKQADYSQVYELIEEADNIDKSLYTDESVEVLEDAIASVDYSKNGLEQSDVDAMALNIKLAIDSLVKKVEVVDLTTSLEATVETNPETSDPILLIVLVLLVSSVGIVFTGRELCNFLSKNI